MTDGRGSLEARLQGLLARVAASTPGRRALMAVERGDGSFRWAGAIGAADPSGRPMTAETPFFIASIDKLLNAAIVLKLVESGRLDLDATLSSCLPRDVTRGLHRLDGVDYSDRITIRHLLGHSSGLADWLEDRPRGGRSLVERVVQGGDVAFGLDDIAALVRDELRPHFPPQDLASPRPRVRYCDTNYMLLAAVVEAVTGQPLHLVHDDMLYGPLGMRRTFLPGHSGPRDPGPAPAVLYAGGRPLAIPRLMRSLNAVYSTTGDALLLLRGVVNGTVFQRPATLAGMQHRWHRFGFPLDRAALRAPGWPIEYGLGIMRFRLPRIFTPLRAMPAVVGHTGSTGCWLFHCAERDLLLAGSVDEVTAGAVPYRIVPRILRLFPPERPARGQTA